MMLKWDRDTLISWLTKDKLVDECCWLRWLGLCSTTISSRRCTLKGLLMATLLDTALGITPPAFASCCVTPATINGLLMSDLDCAVT
jgi:hypothetical protein